MQNNMHGKILVVTSIEPNQFNSGGHPSGLIWEILNSFRMKEVTYDLEIYSDPSSGLRKRFHQYGFLYHNKLKIKEEYSSILVYPENIIAYIPKRFRSRCIVLGPDSPSLRDARLYRASKGTVFRIIRLGMYFLSLYHEYLLLKQSYRVLVVGRTDQLWMRLFNQRIKRNPRLIKKVRFLRHPFLSKVVFPLSDLVYKKDNKTNHSYRRFVFSGFINERYTCDFIGDVIRHLDKNIKYHFVITGSRNAWLAELLKKNKLWIVDYYKWIEDYRDVCQIGKDIHCLPDRVGAGTKNRGLTALINGLEIITTPFGIENIKHAHLSGIYIAESPRLYAQYMANLFKSRNSDAFISNILKERREVRFSIEHLYEIDINQLMIDLYQLQECKAQSG